ncbi:HAD-IIIC family phosphatase [Alkaliphilus transvaalensis]|uniref:HAD-IIIC family phosphatase n=1 Tax=Alkaliphilus transvaalensis TaxID=114628 RepID=UPI0005510DEB|nr:HAD-IIIC family phosphatase [Alkaliphilus transvaalensis]
MGEERKIKCVVWDLDNTIWDGTLIEDSRIKLKDNIRNIIKELDHRGILQSIASKNDHSMAMEKLNELGLVEYFLYPQINWNAKSSSISQIKSEINIGMDTIAFVDDQAFEREEVNSELPEVLCIDASLIDRILDMPEMNPKFITKDSKQRRLLYMSDIKRNKLEETYVGPKEDFLKSLNMKLIISPVMDDDLKRAEELTVRTNQLNATGYTYSYEELDALRFSDDHILLMAELEDKYGTYGKIGLALLECKEDVWIIKLLLMSCRVISRGVGSILLNHILTLGKKAGVKVLAEFKPTDRNRMMYITYKFAGFEEVEEKEDLVMLEYKLEEVPNMPDYVDLNIIEGSTC